MFIALSCRDNSPIKHNIENNTNNNTNNSNSNDNSNNLEDNIKVSEVSKKLLNGILRGEEEIDVSSLNLNEGLQDSIYYNFLSENPLLFHLKKGNNFGIRSQYGKLTAIIPQYTIQPKYLDEAFNIIERELSDMLKSIDYRMTDEEIAYKQHNMSESGIRSNGGR